MTRRLLAHPAVHFLLIGAALFAAVRWLRPPERPEPEPIGLSADRAAIDAELLMREAIALGFHESDPIVRRRLIRNMRFLSRSNADSNDEALFAEALALGMEQSDVVVRRRLSQRMRLLVDTAARAEEPGDAELREYLKRNRGRFAEPARVRLSQVYLSRERRGGETKRDALRLLAGLRAARVAPERAWQRGDPFLLPARFGLRSEPKLAASFGPDFARAVMKLKPGLWSGPIASSYGLHLVWIHERRPARPRPLDAVRSELRESLLAERQAQALEAVLRELRRRYGVGPSS